MDIQALIDEGWRRKNQPRRHVNFAPSVPDAQELMNNIEEYGHLFVFGCVMDRQIKAERAWLIPYTVGKELGGFDFQHFLAADEQRYIDIFASKKLHRFNEVMAKVLHCAVRDIDTKYGGVASNIWTGNKPLSSATVVRRFLEFKGVGIKIATMATNILTRDFKVKLSDYYSIDISPDVQVKKFLIRNELIREGASNEEIIYRARELYPEYPGIFDLLAWEEARQYPRKQKSAAPVT